MKKFLALALTGVMALSLLTACGSKDDANTEDKTGNDSAQTETLSGTVSTDNRPCSMPLQAHGL